MKITQNGFIHRQKIIITAIFIGNDVNVPEGIEMFFGTISEARQAGIDYESLEAEELDIKQNLFNRNKK